MKFLKLLILPFIWFISADFFTKKLTGKSVIWWWKNGKLYNDIFTCHDCHHYYTGACHVHFREQCDMYNLRQSKPL